MFKLFGAIVKLFAVVVKLAVLPLRLLAKLPRLFGWVKIAAIGVLVYLGVRTAIEASAARTAA